MEAVKTEKTVKIYGDELEKVAKKIKVETLNYNCIDVRAFRDDGETWLFIADLHCFFEKDAEKFFYKCPEDGKRRYKRDSFLNLTLKQNGKDVVKAVKESCFLDEISIRNSSKKYFVCYQCGSEIDQRPVVKRGFSVCHDGRTERRIARFHYMCFGG